MQEWGRLVSYHSSALVHALVNFAMSTMRIQKHIHSKNSSNLRVIHRRCKFEIRNQSMFQVQRQYCITLSSIRALHDPSNRDGTIRTAPSISWNGVLAFTYLTVSFVPYVWWWWHFAKEKNKMAGRWARGRSYQTLNLRDIKEDPAKTECAPYLSYLSE